MFYERSLKQLGDTTEAFNVLEQGRKRFPDNLKLLLEEAQVYLEKGEANKLIISLKEAIAKDTANPNNANFNFLIGKSYDDKGETDSAEMFYKRALEINSKFFEAYYNIGAIYVNKASDLQKTAGDLPLEESDKYNKLIDKTANLRHADSKTLNPKKWFGAYYYKIIETRNGSKNFYTLLAWKGYDRSKTMKLIEIATIRSNGDVVFGYPLFNIREYEYFKNKRARRLIFTFSSQVKMFLDYDTQSIHIKKNTKKKKKSHKKQRGFRPISKEVSSKEKIKTITKPMIVMDRLEPTNKEMTEFYEFYFPETNVVDALLFEKGKWNYFPDVDARNTLENEKNAKPKKPINYDL